MRLLKLLLLIIILAPATLIAILYFTPERIDFAKYQPQMENYLQQKSGYKVLLGENLKIRLFPTPHFSSEGLKVKAFQGEKPLFTAKKVSADVSIKDILTMTLALDKVLVQDPKIYLHNDINGKANWEPKRKRSGSSGAVDLSFLSGIGNVVISNVDFVYEDDLSGSQFSLKEGQFSISGERLNKTKVDFSGLLNSQKVESSLNVNLSSLIEVPVSGEIKLSENTIKLKGFIDELLTLPSYNGELEITGDSILPTFYEILHIAPNQRAINFPIQAKGMVDLSSSFVKFEKYNVQLDVSETPVVFDLTAEYNLINKSEDNTIELYAPEHLNFSGFKFCQKSSNKKSGSKFEWPETIMDFDYLKGMNLNVDVQLLKGFECGKHEFSYAKLRAKVANQQVRVTQFKLDQESGGNLRGTAKLNVKSTPKGDLTLSTHKLNVTEFISKNAVKRATFPIDSNLKLDFSGRTLKDWVSSLEGTVESSSEGVVLYGMNLSSLTRMLKDVLVGGITGKETEDYGRFSLVGSIADGVFKSDEITLKLADADIIAKGKADLVRMTMNFRAEPNPENSLGFKNPVNIKGSIMSPSIIPEATTSQKVGATVGGAIGGPAGAALGGVLGAIMESGPKRDVSKTDMSGDEIMKEKQRLQEEVLKFLEAR